MVIYNQFSKSHALCFIIFFLIYVSTTSVLAASGSTLSLYCYDKQPGSGVSVQLGQCSRANPANLTDVNW